MQPVKVRMTRLLFLKLKKNTMSKGTMNFKLLQKLIINMRFANYLYTHMISNWINQIFLENDELKKTLYCRFKNRIHDISLIKFIYHHACCPLLDLFLSLPYELVAVTDSYQRVNS